MSKRMSPMAIAVISTGLAVAVATTTLIADAGTAPPPAALSLVAADKHTVELNRYGGSVDLSGLGLYLTVGEEPIEIRLERGDYAKALTGQLSIGTGSTATKKRIPHNLIGFDGLRALLRITITDKSGNVKFALSPRYCGGNLGNEGIPLTPDAPEGADYPWGGCSDHPFALGSILGFDPMQAFPVVVESSSYEYDDGDYFGSLNMPQKKVPDGRYTLTVTLGTWWRKALDVPEGKASASVPIKLVTETDNGYGYGSEPLPSGVRNLAVDTGPVIGGLRLPVGNGAVTSATHSSDGGPLGVRIPASYAGRIDGTLPRRDPSDTAMGRTASGQPLADPSETEALRSTSRRATAAVPEEYRPDLRPLPAFGFDVMDPAEAQEFAEPGYGAVPGHEYLSFSATVWNAGPGPLVVDGFRKPGASIMQAYQSFYDPDGGRHSYAPTGSMAYDPRPGHEHWHFLDFATYQLRTKSGRTVRSQKEAFCLAPTDAIDLLVTDAQWQPASTGLSTACGSVSALGIRETLEAGWGDTYGQYLPGQAFDITNLPNGTYKVEVIANPMGALYESDTENNLATRTIVLGGKKGDRTVRAIGVGLVSAP